VISADLFSLESRIVPGPLPRVPSRYAAWSVEMRLLRVAEGDVP